MFQDVRNSIELCSEFRARPKQEKASQGIEINLRVLEQNLWPVKQVLMDEDKKD
jgi:hypothetical protein